MTLIDRRILITAPPQVVWEVLEDHQSLAKWRNDCQSVSLLTTKGNAVGARRRVRPRLGKDFIEEITVWYDGLGYEYTIVEGSPYKTYTARIRLQATPDGTIVQWTILFQTKSLLGRLLGNRRHRGRLSRLCEDSLRRLRRHVEGLGIGIDDKYRSKVGVRPGPSIDERQSIGAKRLAAEQARRLANASREISTAMDVLPTVADIQKNAEPPIRKEDTPIIAAVEPPSFIKDELTPISLKVSAEPPKPADSLEDTRPNPAISLGSDTPQEASLPTTPEKVSADDHALESKAPTVESVPTPSSIFTPTLEEESKPRRPDLPSPTGKRDTGEVSIWDVFGVKPPSTAEIKLAELSPEVAAEIKPPPASPPPTSSIPVPPPPKAEPSSLELWLAANEPPLPSGATGTISTLVRLPDQPRVGLRKRQRYQHAKVRLPRRRGNHSH